LSVVRTGRLNPPGNAPGTHFCYRLSRPQGHSAAGRIMSMKNSNDTIGNRTRDLPKSQIFILCSFLFLSMEFLEIQVVSKVLRWFDTSVNFSRHRVTSQKSIGIARSKRDGTRAETRSGLSAKRTSPFKSAGVSVQSTAGSRGVRISGQQLYRPCSVVQCEATGYPLHSHLSPSLPLPCVTVCHQVPNAL